MKNHKARFFTAAIIAAAPSLVMGAFPLLGFAPWERTSLEMLALVAVIYSAVHVFFALLIMVVSRKVNALLPSIMLGVLVGGAIGLPLATAMRMEGYDRAGERATPLIHAVEAYIEKTGAPPQHLDLLVPDFIDPLPAGIPPFKIVTGPKAVEGFYQNDWALVFGAGSGLNWDALVYLPRQNYEEIESKTLLGSWAYLHE
ncbi:hypothetical protein ACM7MW_05670 [Pseudomonas aeruginosa]|uniref:hypothetical protein n=1 Tax=Pseudomonas aeruginosa TaxID=287 RepID=UPI000FFE3E6D|nr:hypothetical protein [Pseudomonas aeruginosa]MCC0375752.1 hypothetical protein [Pseudomonas aeruginosa]HBO4815180.1 hypothetical protein [Pseudomonas aeruginosa]HCF0751132.1 hypothetical protein [Pseudomonas aeruginosa]HEJ3701613.1 hypothetical protein [Pseudomonas aeruginosa]HEJ3838875.1 hypothetical protein [Pseudomonas aeruginosa]